MNDNARKRSRTAQPSQASRIPPALTRPFGCEHLHLLAFRHRDDRGKPSPVVSISIPECWNRLETAAWHARLLKARVLVVADSHHQVVAARARAALLLPEHQEIGIERALGGGWGPPS